MTEEQQKQVSAACTKAACTGFAQSLINKGYGEEQVKQATVLYAHPDKGLLTKRATNVEQVRRNILEKVAQLRGKAPQPATQG